MPSTNFCEGLNALSFRWTHPTQQHGRRIPSLSSGHTRSICSRRVSDFLTEMVQQIHSLRAMDVILSNAAKALSSAARTFCKSAGRSCTTPPEIFLFIFILYQIRCYRPVSSEMFYQRGGCRSGTRTTPNDILISMNPVRNRSMCM